MRFLFVLFLFYLIALQIVCARNENYKGYKVFKVKFTDSTQDGSLELLKNDAIDFWRRPSFKHDVIGLVMVPPTHFQWFEEKVHLIGAESTVFIYDVYEYLLQKERTSPVTFRSRISRQFDFNSYHRYDEILEYLNAIQSTTTTDVNVIQYGVTEENRPLLYVKVTNNSTADDKPVVVVEAGVNPREWITIPSAINAINELLKDENVWLVDAFDWIVIPVLNPDGYEYSHTDLRFWQKTTTTSSYLGFICPGVNINRNFDIDWSISDSSTSPCSHLYAGSEPFSEIESRLIRDILTDNEGRIKLYISLQNNGGFVSYPWNYERAASGMFIQNHLVALEMIEAFNQTGYFVDSGSLAFGDRASGTNTDYARTTGVQYAYNVDIMPDEEDGVIIPESDIEGIAQTVWNVIEVAATKLT